MKVIALTGGFATGKSTVAGILKQFGVPVFDMDKAGHDVLATNQKIINAVGRRFPEAVKDGKIDRAKLGAIVFKDKVALHWLEKHIHPEIFKLQDRFIKRAQHAGKKSVLVEIPLLFEIKAEKFYDLVLLTTTSPFQQKRRAMKRPHMTEKKLKDILARQLPTHIKRRKADKEIFTGLGYADTMHQVRKIWYELTRYP